MNDTMPTFHAPARTADLQQIAVSAIDCIAARADLRTADIDALIAIGTHALKHATALRVATPIDPPSQL